MEPLRVRDGESADAADRSARRRLCRSCSFDLHQAPQAIREIDVAAAFRERLGPPIQTDLVVDPSADLGQQSRNRSASR